jgi:hypothetical protein
LYSSFGDVPILRRSSFTAAENAAVAARILLAAGSFLRNSLFTSRAWILFPQIPSWNLKRFWFQETLITVVVSLKPDLAIFASHPAATDSQASPAGNGEACALVDC